MSQTSRQGMSQTSRQGMSQTSRQGMSQKTLRQVWLLQQSDIADAAVSYDSKHIKGSKERLFIRTQTHNLQIFGIIPLSSYKTTLLKQLNG